MERAGGTGLDHHDGEESGHDVRQQRGAGVTKGGEDGDNRRDQPVVVPAQGRVRSAERVRWCREGEVVQRR